MAKIHKYKVGDVIRIVYQPPNEEICLGFPGWCDMMDEFCGKIATIEAKEGTYMYKLKDFPFLWTDEMFDGLYEEENELKDPIDDTELSTFLHSFRQIGSVVNR